MPRPLRVIVNLGALVLPLLAGPAGATETERLYLSGTGPDDAVEWDFSIDSGRRSGVWTRIRVPSQWELEGFGEFSYGRDDEVRAEVGSYRTSFAVPAPWRDRTVRLVFEGAMTDVEAVLNGRSVGPRHRGGFTRFFYDVSGLLRFDGASNLLEIEVSEASDDLSVNAAEREADYWVFGGIYRPVYLEALPRQRIEHVAIDARHDGEMRVEVDVLPDDRSVTLLAAVLDRNGVLVGRLDAAGRRPGSGARILQGSIADIEPWSAERPRIYELEIELLRTGIVHHRVRHRFGFRTIEVRPGAGLRVNGSRVLLKGINRHSLWPETGRALTRAQNRRDAELIKELNANAVRVSHYPPDSEFLDACDELGLYVIDEIPGWHASYRRDLGRHLVGEVVRRDVNHPSVILWANGNEGGWNALVEGELHRHDPQRRPVIHPQDVWGGFDTVHYPAWAELQSKLAGGTTGRLRNLLGPRPLVMPTEMLHGLYDGGLGAGLADYWQLIRSSPRSAGGFLWSFADEGIIRADRGDAVDTHGSYGPDGIVDPFRVPEPSFAAVRSVWSPVVFAEPPRVDAMRVGLRLENRFDETDLASCRLRWRWLRMPSPGPSAGIGVVGRGETSGPPAAPGASGELTIARVEGGDVLELVAEDPDGRDVWSETILVVDRAALVGRWLGDASRERGTAADERTALEALGLSGLAELGSGAPAETTWRRHAGEWLRLEVATADAGDSRDELRGVFVDGLVSAARSVEWLGRGPSPVWRNRIHGPRLGLWKDEPEPGFFADVLWIRVDDGHGLLTIVLETDGTFTGFSAPRFPHDGAFARAPVPPEGALSLLSTIPAIGTKFHRARDLAPDAPPDAPNGASRFVVWLQRSPGP